MGRVAYVIPIAPDRVDDVRKTAADLRPSLEEFGRTRAEIGLTSVGVWLQETSWGHILISVVEGDVEGALQRSLTDSGFDAWVRTKLEELAASPADVANVYRFPPSEELFSWRA